MKIKETCASLRPYEKCLTYGPGVLTDEELLAVIIRCGTKDEDSVSLSKRVLSFRESDNGILNIIDLSIKDLLKIKGIGKVKAIQIKCIGELSRRISQKSHSIANTFVNASKVASYCMESMRHLKYEKFLAIMLDSACHYLGELEVSKGTVNSSIASPREIFIEALKIEAVNIILVHNHPSGDTTPSKEDINTTNVMIEAGNLIGIHIIDHVIIGDNKYFSLCENNLLNTYNGGRK